MMESLLNKEVQVAKAVTDGVEKNEQVLSPGMKYKHYAPNANVTIIKSSLEKFIEFVNSHKTQNSFVMCFEGEENLMPTKAIAYGKQNDPQSQAHNLFSVLREMDKNHAEQVFVRCPEMTGISLAVYNRLIRSASFNIIEI